MSVLNHRLLFSSVPEGYPVPGETTQLDTSQSIDLDGVALDGGFLLKTLVVASDPFVRSRMRAPDKEGYVPPFVIGKPCVLFLRAALYICFL